jgi:hypothetical protein
MRTIRTLAAVSAVALTALAGVLATQSAAKAVRPPTGPVPDITVRVEGLAKTLLAPTTVTLANRPVSKGVAAESCGGLSALGALQDATRGSWSGAWSKSYKEYFVGSILGESYGPKADYYWAFWLDDKPAPVGACEVDPAKGSSILFFPEYDGKSKTIVAPSVLGISAPAGALVGKPFTVLVTSYANANGKATPAVGAQVRAAGGVNTTVASGGRAALTIGQSGNVVVEVTAPNSLRDETTVCIHKPGATCAG